MLAACARGARAPLFGCLQPARVSRALRRVVGRGRRARSVHISAIAGALREGSPLSRTDAVANAECAIAGKRRRASNGAINVRATCALPLSPACGGFRALGRGTPTRARPRRRGAGYGGRTPPAPHRAQDTSAWYKYSARQGKTDLTERRISGAGTRDSTRQRPKRVPTTA